MGSLLEIFGVSSCFATARGGVDGYSPIAEMTAFRILMLRDDIHLKLSVILHVSNGPGYDFVQCTFRFA